MARVDNRPKCSHCKEKAADVVEHDYLYSCAACWNKLNIPKDWKNKCK